MALGGSLEPVTECPAHIGVHSLRLRGKVCRHLRSIVGLRASKKNLVSCFLAFLGRRLPKFGTLVRCGVTCTFDFILKHLLRQARAMLTSIFYHTE